MAIATHQDEAERLIDLLIELAKELLCRFGNVYDVLATPRLLRELLLRVFDRLAREVSPRPQPADLADDEVLKGLARAAARLPPADLFLRVGEDAPPEEQLVRDCANVLFAALAESGRQLEGVDIENLDQG